MKNAVVWSKPAGGKQEDGFLVLAAVSLRLFVSDGGIIAVQDRKKRCPGEEKSCSDEPSQGREVDVGARRLVIPLESFRT